MRELYKDLNIVADIKCKRLEWIEHVVRMNQGRTIKKIFESKPKESRRGRQTEMAGRWREESTGDEGYEMMTDGSRQGGGASVIKEAKALWVSTIHEYCKCISLKLMLSKTEVHNTLH